MSYDDHLWACITPQILDRIVQVAQLDGIFPQGFYLCRRGKTLVRDPNLTVALNATLSIITVGGVLD